MLCFMLRSLSMQKKKKKKDKIQHGCFQPKTNTLWKTKNEKVALWERIGIKN